MLLFVRNGRRIVMSVLAAMLLPCATTRAGLILEVNQPDGVIPNGATYSFDISLTNAGPTAVSIQSFVFWLFAQTNDTGVTFDSVTSHVNGYIFTGQSIYGPDITVPSSDGQMIGARDFSTRRGGVRVGAGETVDIGRVYFTPLYGEAGIGDISFLADRTSVVDTSGAGLGLTLVNRQFNIPGFVAAPEPSLPAMLGGLALAGVGRFWRRRRRSRNGHRSF
jgi:hypothetical protein